MYRTFNSLQFLFFTFFFVRSIVTACRNRAYIVCPSTGISDSNVYTNETGMKQDHDNPEEQEENSQEEFPNS
jgi:hypothetical protein